MVIFVAHLHAHSRPGPSGQASGFLVLRLNVLNLGSVTGVLQHPTQVDDLLRVDVLVVGTFECLGLSSEGHKEPTGTVLLNRSHSIQ